jgi:hypothetical protein
VRAIARVVAVTAPQWDTAECALPSFMDLKTGKCMFKRMN